MPRHHDRIAAVVLAVVFVGANMTAAGAALPPYWQSAREIEAIVGDARVHDALKYEEPIQSVEKTGDNVYTLKTPRCTVAITVVYKPITMVGPAQFDLEVGQADCQ